MKRPYVFNDALTFIDDTSLYILVPGNLEGDQSEEVVLTRFVHGIFESAWYTYMTNGGSLVFIFIGICITYILIFETERDHFQFFASF
jgi:hypothetical protein